MFVDTVDRQVANTIVDHADPTIASPMTSSTGWLPPRPEPGAADPPASSR
jgi:hypothetical protein